MPDAEIESPIEVLTITSSDEGVEIDHTDGINAYEAVGLMVAGVYGTLLGLFDELEDEEED